MELRWFYEKNQIDAEAVRKYSDEHGLPFAPAKQALEQRTPKRLQYRDHDQIWQDVPTVCYVREPDGNARLAYE